MNLDIEMLENDSKDKLKELSKFFGISENKLFNYIITKSVDYFNYVSLEDVKEDIEKIRYE